MKAFVTGAAGFIGSHLVNRLLRDGATVIGFDNLSASTSDTILSIGNQYPGQFTLIKGDIRDLSELKSAIKGCNVVFHLAAAGSVPESVEQPEFYHENNVTGTFNALLAARDEKVNRFIFSSSAAVYGDNDTLPNHELMASRPLSPYAVGKLAGEAYCMAFYAAYQLPTIAFRYFNVFGPRQNPRSQYAAAIPKFIDLCNQNLPITIFGDGLQTRDFVYIDDVVQANILASQCDNHHLGSVINVGSGVPISVTELAETIRKIKQSTVDIHYLPPRPGDIKDSLSDISRLKVLGLTNPISLNHGLKTMLLT